MTEDGWRPSEKVRRAWTRLRDVRFSVNAKPTDVTIDQVVDDAIDRLSCTECHERENLPFKCAKHRW